MNRRESWIPVVTNEEKSKRKNKNKNLRLHTQRIVSKEDLFRSEKRRPKTGGLVDF